MDKKRKREDETERVALDFWDAFPHIWGTLPALLGPSECASLRKSCGRLRMEIDRLFKIVKLVCVVTDDMSSVTVIKTIIPRTLFGGTFDLSEAKTAVRLSSSYPRWKYTTPTPMSRCYRFSINEYSMSGDSLQCVVVSVSTIDVNRNWMTKVKWESPLGDHYGTLSRPDLTRDLHRWRFRVHSTEKHGQTLVKVTVPCWRQRPPELSSDDDSCECQKAKGGWIPIKPLERIKRNF